MPTVRISGNRPNNIHKMEWLGAPALDKQGHLERTLEIPEEAYEHIERGIAKGFIEGIFSLKNGLRFEWFLDR